MSALRAFLGSFHFIWPHALWLCLGLPLMVAAYFWILGRHRSRALRWPGLAQVREAQRGGSQWRRHFSPALFLAAMSLFLVALARPEARLSTPSNEQTLVLAMDVSASMGATDVEPDRLTAAQAAAKRLVSELPEVVRVGVVSFAGSAALVQPPTRDRESVYAAIDRFQLQPGTAIGSGMVVALSALFPNDKIDMAGMADAVSIMGDRQDGAIARRVEPGSFASAAIVLLTDGQRTAGPDALAVARLAADRGVRVYTVGVGTKEGKTIRFQGWSVRVKLDEDTLRGIASETRGEYFNASTAGDLMAVYRQLQSRIVLRSSETELSALFAGVGALLALVSAGLSLWWYQRFL